MTASVGEAHDALCLLATEWWKASRRLLRLAAGDAASGAASGTASGRYERERSQLAYSGRRVAAALEAHGLRLRDFDGQAYSPALPPEPVNPEDFDTEEGLVVADTIEPTVLHDGRIVLRGKVVLRRAEG